MNHHLRILQHRIQPVAVGSRYQIKATGRICHAQRFEWTRHKIADGQKEKLHARQNHADVRHQLAIFIAVSEQHGYNINR